MAVMLPISVESEWLKKMRTGTVRQNPVRLSPRILDDNDDDDDNRDLDHVHYEHNQKLR